MCECGFGWYDDGDGYILADGWEGAMGPSGSRGPRESSVGAACGGRLARTSWKVCVVGKGVRVCDTCVNVRGSGRT